MLAAIAGDIIGPVHEGARTKTKEFQHFVADSIDAGEACLYVNSFPWGRGAIGSALEWHSRG